MLSTMLTTYLLALVHPRRPYDALWFAVSPCLLLTGFVDELGSARGGLRRRSPVGVGARPTGVDRHLLGIGTATKLYPLFLLGPCW